MQNPRKNGCNHIDHGTGKQNNETLQHDHHVTAEPSHLKRNFSASLKQARRDAIEQAHIEGMSYAKLAPILGLTAGRVSDIARGRSGGRVT